MVIGTPIEPCYNQHMRLTIFHPQPPYRFDLLLNVLSRYAHPTLDIVKDEAYWRVVRAGAGLMLLKVTVSGLAENPVLEVHQTAHSGDVNPAEAAQNMRRILAIDSSQTAFYDFARRDAQLWSIIKSLVGMPPLQNETVFDALVQTIIEQQIAWTTAQKAQRWLVDWAGNTVEHDGQLYYAFPTSAQLANATIDDLKPLKITHIRIKRLIAIAQAVEQGDIDLTGLAALSSNDAYDQLMDIPGVGHWTAAVTVARAFGHSMLVPHNDVALQAAVNRYFYGGVGRIPAQQVMDTFAPYGDYAGIAAHYTLLRWVLDQYPVV